MNKKQKRFRTVTLSVLIFALFSVYILRLVSLQLVNGESYLARANSSVSSNILVKAARGDILDRNGMPLVTNEQGNSLVFTYAYFPRDQKARNALILSLINLMEANGGIWIDKLPLVLSAGGEPEFPANRDSDIATLKSKNILNLNDYATARNCFDALVEKYSLQEYSAADARKIASVCYEMTRQEFSGSIPYTFAEKVPTEIVSKVKENSAFYQGVDVDVVPYRTYTDGTLAPHVLGRVAALDPDEYKELKAKGYRITDYIGKDGIERAAEKHLRGTDGTKQITTDANGSVSEEYTKEPEQGNSVILTIDANLQKVAQDALDEIVPTFPKQLYASGSAVVVDVRNGEILACATNPRYDVSTFAQNYSAMADDPKTPLWNRPLQSAYAPGSSFKPLVAMAGLEENVISRTSTYHCTGIYNRYTDTKFGCLGNHGNINVMRSLDVSCNIFFYETGYYLGIEKLAQYSTMFGIGQKTGVELPEVAGSISTPEVAEAMAKAIGSDPNAAWSAGQVIQTAIGQSYNAVTPLQMADYCAMIATGGTRFVPHFIKSVKSADYSRTVLDNSAGEIAYQANFKPENVQTLRDGMYQMATDPSNYAHLLNTGKLKDIGVCAKTGTPQLLRTDEAGVPAQPRNNSFLIAFAPKDNPQIAACVVLEDAKKSNFPVAVMQKILEAYFDISSTGNVSTPQQSGQLLD